jgi:hypothetical protein
MVREVDMLRVLLVLLLALPGWSEAQTAPGRQGGPGRRGGAPPRPERLAAAIEGRVIDAATGAPVRRAQIQAMGDEDVRIASSDDEGRFELRDLGAGAWSVTASKSGYIRWQFGQRRPFEVPPPIRLSAGQRFTADIPITRGGAITGRVYDEYGEAVTGARVDVLRPRMTYGRRHLQRIGAGDQTDDTGAFRVYGLAPGEYYVTASLRVAPLDSVIGTTYSPTYFPGTGNVAEALRISLELGAEANADFQVLPVRPVRVSGIVLNSAGAPADAFLNLVSDASELGVPLGLGGATRPDGSFTLPDVAPGLYTLNAMNRETGVNETAAIPLTVGTDDLTGITLVTARAATMRGSIVPDAGVTRPLPRGLGVSARGARPGGTTAQGMVTGNRFQIADLDGPFLLEVEDVPEGWAVTSISVNGVDAADVAIDLKGQQDAAARIVLTDRITDVSGVVTPRGAAPDLRVVVFAEDATRWTYRSRFVRTVSADAQGRFRVTALPPGERYLAIAVDYLEDEEGDDPDFLAKMKDHATSFTPMAGERTTVDLQLVQR